MSTVELTRKNRDTYGQENITLINVPRGTGATTTLLRAASRNKGVYVALNRQIKDYATRLAKELKLKPLGIFTYEELKNKHNMGLYPLGTPYYLDDVHSYLSKELGDLPLKGLSI